MWKQVSCQKEDKEESAAADEAGFPVICRSFDILACKITQEDKRPAPKCGGNSA